MDMKFVNKYINQIKRTTYTEPGKPYYLGVVYLFEFNTEVTLFIQNEIVKVMS